MKKMITVVLVFIIMGIALFFAYQRFRANTVEDAPEPSQTDEVQEAVDETINIGFVNKVMPADVWIIENTEKNRKTSVRGTASVKSTELEKEYNAVIRKNKDDSYLFRMIDTDHIYYSADDLRLKDGYSIEIFKSDSEFENIVIAVYDEKGEQTEEKNVFNAAL